MRFRLFGNSGLRVSELCLGTMTFGEQWGWGASPEICADIVKTYLDAGGNFFDTADCYTDGTSETILGNILHSRRDEYVIATKYSLTTRPHDANACGSHRKNLSQSLNGSLKRLRTDFVDLLWVNIWDPFTPVDEVMRALDDVVRAGKVLYVGISDTPAWVVSQSNMLANLRGWSPFVGLQLAYNLLERSAERELLPMAASLNLAATTWNVLGNGLLSGKYSSDSPPQVWDRLANEQFRLLMTERNLQFAAMLESLADECNCSTAQLAIAWVLHRRDRANIIPILDARTVVQLRDSLGSLEVFPPTEIMEKLDSITAIDRGFPHEFLKCGQDAIYGSTLAKLETCQQFLPHNGRV